MAELVTASGPKRIGSWGIQLQGSPGSGGRLDASALMAAEHDLLVLDFSSDGTDEGRYFGEDIHRLKGRSDNAVVLAYLPLGGVFDYRSNWQPDWSDNGLASGNKTDKAPAWLGPVHPSSSSARLVRYWDDAWLETIINERRSGWADLIAAQSFDGVYLDLVDVFAFWGEGGGTGEPKTRAEAATSMIGAVDRLARHIRIRYPDFLIVPANAEALVAAVGGDASRRDFFDTISAVAAEDVFCPGAQRENNPFKPDAARIEALTSVLRDADKPVLTLEYIDEPTLLSTYTQAAAALGFVPCAAPSRDLDRLGPAFTGDIAPIGRHPGELPAAATRSGGLQLRGRPGDAPRFRWRSREPA